MIPVIRVFCRGSEIYMGTICIALRPSLLSPSHPQFPQLAPTLSRAAKLRGVQIDVFKYGRGIIKTSPASACSSCFWWKFPIIPHKWLRKNLRRSTVMIFKQFSLQSQAPRIDDRWDVLASHYSVSKFPSRSSLETKEWRWMSLKSERSGYELLSAICLNKAQDSIFSIPI